MQDLLDLQRRFTIPGAVAIASDAHGFPLVVVATSHADAHVYLHGAHVTHYQRKGQAPLLFMSAKSWFQDGKPIRGGVPIVFPWFGPSKTDPRLPAHGVARTRAWQLQDVRQDAAGVVSVLLSLRADDATRALWPHEFELHYTVTVGATLGMALEVRNVGSVPFSFEEALHTYLWVRDVREVSVTGLAGRNFFDKLDVGRMRPQPPEPIRIIGETDRIYVATPDPVTVTGGGRSIIVSKQDSQETVVWNPWIDKSKAMPDFGDDEWPTMICIETANIGDHAVTLQPGERHTMRAELSESSQD